MKDMELEKKLVEILKDTKECDYQETKEKLEIYDDWEMIKLLLSSLQKEICNFDFVKMPSVCKDYLNKELKLFNYYLDNIELNDPFYVFSEVINIEKKIKKRLNNSEKDNSQSFDYDNIVFLECLSYQIELIKNKILESNRLTKEEQFEIFSILLFEKYDKSNIDNFLNRYPDVIYIKNENGTMLFKILLNEFSKLLFNDENDLKLIYYYDCIKKILSYDSSKSLKLVVMKKVKKNMSRLNNKKISITQKERKIYFLESLISCVENVDSKENLKLKYAINDKPIFNKLSFKLLNYKNQNHDDIITIDFEGSKVLEQAISMKKDNQGRYQLQFYISDVSSYICDELLIEYIYNQYFDIPDSHLISKKAILNDFSLKENVPTKVVVYCFDLDQNLNVVNFHIERQLIKVKYNLTFSDITNMIKTESEDVLRKKILELLSLAEYMNGDYKKKNIYHMYKEYSKKMLYDDEYHTVDKKANIIVSDYTIFLNNFLAEYCFDRKLPYIYRNNYFIDKEEEDVDKKLNQYLELQLFNLSNNNSLTSIYSEKNRGHMGLNKRAYGEITRPCRSLVSITNQKLLNQYFFKSINPLDFDKINLFLKNECDKVNMQRILYNKFSYEKKLLKKI